MSGHPILTVTAVGLLVILAGFVAVGAVWFVVDFARTIVEAAATLTQALNPLPSEGK